MSAYGYVAERRFWMHFPSLASYRFDRKSAHITAFPCFPNRESVIRDVYCRSVLPMALQVRGREVLHASAVLGGAGSVLFCGLAGAGKSTIAFALSRRGYRQLADDSVALERVDGSVRSLGMPFAVRLRPGPARHFGEPSKMEPPSSLPARTGLAGVRLPLKALFVLDRVTGRASRVAVSIEPLSASEFFTAVLPHAYCFSLVDPARKRRMIRQYLELGSRVPSFRLRFGSGLTNLPSVLDRIEEVIGRF